MTESSGLKVLDVEQEGGKRPTWLLTLQSPDGSISLRTLKEISALTGIGTSALRTRINLGKPLEKLLEPVKPPLPPRLKAVSQENPKPEVVKDPVMAAVRKAHDKLPVDRRGHVPWSCLWAVAKPF